MRKIISVVGARPNFMKVAPIHRAFQKYKSRAEHKIVHTGQHYSQNMSAAFFEDLEMPHPEHFLNVGSASHAVQTAKIMIEFEKILASENPDLTIVVGDVNSTIACVLTAAKMGIKTAHIEAGLRSFDRQMPEELNRIATDTICDFCFITEESAFENLKREGFPDEKIFFTGNTMIDSQHFALDKAKKSGIIKELGLIEGEFVPVTIHRPSNVDNPAQLKALLEILNDLAKDRVVVFPVHPRTMKNIEKFGLRHLIENPGIRVIEPLGYIGFLALLINCDFVLTDSGGIQEETTALKKPCITIRTSTERPVTIEMGTNTLVEPSPEKIQEAVDIMLNQPRKVGQIPPLWDGKAAERIAEAILNKCLPE